MLGCIVCRVLVVKDSRYDSASWSIQQKSLKTREYVLIVSDHTSDEISYEP